jgi:hypothetical protein
VQLPVRLERLLGFELEYFVVAVVGLALVSFFYVF